MNEIGSGTEPYTIRQLTFQRQRFSMKNQVGNRRGELANMAEEGQAKAVTDSALLEFLAKELATSSETLVANFHLTQHQVQSRIQQFIDRGWVQARGALESPSAVFRITEDGAEALERNRKRGLSAYI